MRTAQQWIAPLIITKLLPRLQPSHYPITGQVQNIGIAHILTMSQRVCSTGGDACYETLAV